MSSTPKIRIFNWGRGLEWVERAGERVLCVTQIWNKLTASPSIREDEGAREVLTFEAVG
jgi:hypothetical protein